MLNILPTPVQTLGQTNLDIKNNFITINTGFSVDHETFGIAAQGKHAKVTLTDQSSSVPAFGAGEIGLFNQNATPAGSAAISAFPRAEIWLARGATAPYPITGYGFQNAPAEERGWTYLPSGIKMIWGKARIGSAGSTTTVTYTDAGANGVTTFPGFTSVVGSVQLTRIKDGAGVSNPPIAGFGVVVTSTTAGFTFIASSATTAQRDYFWMAIGF